MDRASARDLIADLASAMRIVAALSEGTSVEALPLGINRCGWTKGAIPCVCVACGRVWVFLCFSQKGGVKRVVKRGFVGRAYVDEPRFAGYLDDPAHRQRNGRSFSAMALLTTLLTNPSHSSGPNPPLRRSMLRASGGSQHWMIHHLLCGTHSLQACVKRMVKSESRDPAHSALTPSTHSEFAPPANNSHPRQRQFAELDRNRSDAG